MTKALIFDAGALINLSMNGLLYILPKLKEKFDGHFLITHAVKEEVVDRPMKVQRFELGALRIQKLLDEKVLSLPESLEISHTEIESRTRELVNKINQFVQANGRAIKIVSPGEISCLALADECKKKNVETLIAIDERTTRILSEKPANLEKLMSKKLHMPAKLVQRDFKEFAQYRYIRSTELVYVAHKKGLLNITGPKALEAVLYATKFKGSSISWDEINQLKKL